MTKKLSRISYKRNYIYLLDCFLICRGKYFSINNLKSHHKTLSYHLCLLFVK